MGYYSDPDRYYYGTTAREAFDELDRIESRIARDRRKASLTAAPPAAVPADRPAMTLGASGCLTPESPEPAIRVLPEVTGRQIDLFGLLTR